MTAVPSTLRDGLRHALKQFLASNRDFQILHSTRNGTSSTQGLYVLDSSFNPPTLAHYRLARSALEERSGPTPKRLLLLLATHNADKTAEVDTFADRLLMMRAFATQIDEDGTASQPNGIAGVDVGVTKQPYFHKKAAVIDESKVYSGNPQQIHLLGYDTLTRLFNTKYYAPDHTFACLEPFLSIHRLRVTYRPDDEWGDKAAQEKYVKDIAQGKRAFEGAKPDWAAHIHLVEGKQPNEQPISSTRARKAAGDSDLTTLRALVPSSVQELIESLHLYAAEGPG